MKIKFDMSNLFTNGENHQGKTPSGKFKVTTLENPLLSKQAVTSKNNPKYQITVDPLFQYPIGLVM